MSAPIVDPESSILAYPQYTEWEHTFSAVNSPYGFNLESGSLPTGMTFQRRYSIVVTASTDLITLAGHGLSDGMIVAFADLSAGTGLSPNTRYYVIDSDIDNFKVSTSLGGSPVNITVDYVSGSVFRLGHMTGAATIPGISTIRLSATNGDGTSPAVLFTIGIEPAAVAIDTNLDFVWELTSNQIIPQASSVITFDVPAPTIPPTPRLSAKEGDDMIIRLRITKSGVPLDIDIQDLKFGIKELEPEVTVTVSSEWSRLGTGRATTYLIYGKFDGAALAGALSNYETDGGTSFIGLGEFEMVSTNGESIGPATLRRSSSTFPARVERDINDN